jgi:uncharacterized protein
MAKPNEIIEVTRAISNGWKVGGDSGYGIVVSISKPFRQMRIENGNEMRKYLSDSETQTIIDSSFIPEFRIDDYYKGTMVGIKSLMERVNQNINKIMEVKF